MTHLEGRAFKFFFEQFTHNAKLIEKYIYFVAIKTTFLEKFDKLAESEEIIRQAI